MQNYTGNSSKMAHLSIKTDVYIGDQTSEILLDIFKKVCNLFYKDSLCVTYILNLHYLAYTQLNEMLSWGC